MIMKTSIFYGYGFEVEDVGEKTLCNFVKRHASTIVKRNNEMELKLLVECQNNEYEGIHEVFNDLECEISGRKGVYSIISNIMHTETNIGFQYEPGYNDCNSKAFILFPVNFPSLMNETERELTEEKLKKIVEKYVDELGIDVIPHKLELLNYPKEVFEINAILSMLNDISLRLEESTRYTMDYAELTIKDCIQLLSVIKSKMIQFKSNH